MLRDYYIVIWSDNFCTRRKSERTKRWSLRPHIFFSCTMLQIQIVFLHTQMAAGWIFVRSFPSSFFSIFWNIIEYWPEISTVILVVWFFRKTTITHYCDLFDIFENCHRQHHSKKKQYTSYYITVFPFDRECNE